MMVTIKKIVLMKTAPLTQAVLFRQRFVQMQLITMVMAKSIVMTLTVSPIAGAPQLFLQVQKFVMME